MDPPAGPINKTMDRDDLETARARKVIEELNSLIDDLRDRGLRISSWYGAFDLPGDLGRMQHLNRGYGYQPLDHASDDNLYPWFLYWEIAWLVINNEFRPGERLLDLGGCSSLFACYMAAKGLDVVAVDLNAELVENGDRLVSGTGWRMRNLCADISQLELGERFDHVTSVCVFEHLPVSGRVEANRRVGDLLRDRGSFSITFDYLNPSRRACIDGSGHVTEQFVRPSGLRIRGNGGFHDNGKRYLLHPAHHHAAPEAWRRSCVEAGQFTADEAWPTSDQNEYTFGAIFMQKA